MALDFVLLLGARGLRAFAFGFCAVLIGVHLEGRGLDPSLVGLAITISLAGAALVGLASGWLANRLGRRRILAASGVLMALAGVDIAFATQTWLLLLAGASGMLGASSVDLGSFAGLEQAMLSETTSPARRTILFAHYWLVGGLASAAGGIAAVGASNQLKSELFFVLYALIGLVTGGLALILSNRVEQIELETHSPPPHRNRRANLLYALFAIDSIGGGIASPTVILYWLHVRYGVGPNLLGPAFAGISLISVFSYEVAAWLVRRVGTINTMVFPLMTANILLMAVTLSPSFTIALALLLARFAIGNMDVPVRTSYLFSIVARRERPAAAATANAIRGIFTAAGPFLSGLAIQASLLTLPFVAAGSIKAAYCVILFGAFRKTPIETETEVLL